MKHAFLFAAAAALALASGCRSGSGSGPEQGDAAVNHDGPGLDGPSNGDAGPGDAGVSPDGPPGHTENVGGVWHMPGKEAPLGNCTECHGSDLKGGMGPSCYTCHNNDDHTINRGGHMHLAGASSTCSPCHGPSNTGGLGPACSSCH